MPTVPFFAEAMLVVLLNQNGCARTCRDLAMTLRRAPSKRLSRRAPIAYGPRGKETLESVWESAVCASVSPVSAKWARPSPRA